MKPLQLTLALIKPDCMAQPHVVKEIRDIMLKNGFYMVRTKVLQFPRSEAEKFYSEHKERFFFERLVSYMSSGSVAAHALAHPEAIALWRKLIGPTKTFKAIHEAPTTIRGRFGLTDTRNCVHGSDAVETARREIGFFFPDFDQDNWMLKEESLYREGRVEFDPNMIIHKPV